MWTEKDKYCMISFICETQNNPPTKTNKQTNKKQQQKKTELIDRGQTDDGQRQEGRGVGERSQKLQAFSYKINRS